MKNTLILLVCSFFFILLPFNACKKQQTEEKKLLPIIKRTMLADYGVLDEKQIANKLDNKPNRTYSDFMDLGTAYLWMGDYLKAAEKYESAARLANTTAKLMGALHNKTCVLAYVDLNEALRTVDLMINLQPNNIEAAKLRFALYKQTGKNLGLIASSDRLVTLDPNLAGSEVMEPVTAIVLGTVAVMAIATVGSVTVVALTPPDDRKEVALPIAEGFSKCIGEIPSVLKTTVQGSSFSDKYIN